MTPNSGKEAMQLLQNSTVPVFRILKRITCNHAVLSFIQGTLVCTMLMVAIAQFLATFGVSERMQTAAILCSAVAVVAALGLRSIFQSAHSLRGLAWILLACWVTLFPTLLNFAKSFWQNVNLHSGETSAASLLILSLAASAICLAPGFFLASLLPVSRNSASFGCGLAVAGLTIPILLGSGTSLSFLSLVLGILASVTGSLVLWGLWQSVIESPDSLMESAPMRNEIRLLSCMNSAAMAVSCGGAFAVTLHISRQLVVATLPSLAASWSGGILGISIGYALVKRFRSSHSLAAFGALSGALGMTLMIGGYHWFAETTLWSTAWISKVWLLFLVRGAMLSVMTLPFGLAAGIAIERITRPILKLLLVCAGFSGYLLAFWSPLHPVTVALLCTGLLLTAGLTEWLLTWVNSSSLSHGNTNSAPPHLGKRRILHVQTLFLPALAAGTLLTATFTSGNYRPDLSEKFLFAAAAFTAYRSGIEPSQLPYLDDGRLLVEQETVRGRVSLWKHRGMQFAMRHNGLPVSWTSGAPELGPDNTAEVVSVVLPLVMNSRAERVLLTGNAGTSGLFTALSFPVKEVTSLSSDQTSQTILHDLASRSTLGVLMEDVRLVEQQFDSGLLSLTRPAEIPFDVIVSQDGQAGLLQNLPRFTKAYYLGLRRNLSDNGIMCQRLGYFDLGPEAVERVVSTVQSVFPQVILVEATPGELMLLASSREEPLFNPETVTQLKTEHTREVLSRIGWDWSMVANLGALTGKSTRKFISGQPVIDSLKGNIAFSFPHEVARWGDKWNATRRELTKYGESFGNWLGDVEQVDEIRKRLDDVKLARETMDDHPDQFWVYRSALKKRLQDRPRSDIVQARGGNGLKYGLHPEDQRRKDYLAALGSAVSVPHPEPEAVVRLNDFQDPYDPLVTYFLHQEAAYLLQRTERQEPGLQLAHWLHAIYFAPAQDRSVRDVCEALKLLHHSPESVVEEAARFDHLNGLLEILRFRWDLKLNKSSLSRFEAADVEQSINVTRSALDDMDHLAQAIGLEVEGWSTRREVLEDQLLRPLRVHRSELAKRNIPQPAESVAEDKKSAEAETGK